jgi:hypothetical protein
LQLFFDRCQQFFRRGKYGSRFHCYQVERFAVIPVIRAEKRYQSVSGGLDHIVDPDTVEAAAYDREIGVCVKMFSEPT